MRFLYPCSILTTNDDRIVMPDLTDDDESDEDDKSLTKVLTVGCCKRWFIQLDKPSIFLTLTCNSEWAGTIDYLKFKSTSELDYSTNDILEDFNRRHDSVYKCSFPPPKDSGKDFRKSFLEIAGYNNDQNYDLLTYLKCVSYSNEKGNMDILKFKYTSTVPDLIDIGDDSDEDDA